MLYAALLVFGCYWFCPDNLAFGRVDSSDRKRTVNCQEYALNHVATLIYFGNNKIAFVLMIHLGNPRSPLLWRTSHRSILQNVANIISVYPGYDNSAKVSAFR